MIHNSPEHYADSQQIALIVAVEFHECCNPTCLQSTKTRGEEKFITFFYAINMDILHII